MDFFANLHGLCPVHFPVNANAMTFLDNEVDQAQWGGLDLEQAPDQLVCLCSEVPTFSLPIHGPSLYLIHVTTQPKLT